MKLAELKNAEKLYVFKDHKRVGILERTSAGSIFKYEDISREHSESEEMAIAFNLAFTDKPYETVGDNLPAFFAGLLPEGLRLIALQSVLKTSAADMFSLLAASGNDTIGDVYASISKESGQSTKQVSAIKPEEVSFQSLFEKSIYSDEYGDRLLDSSIAGIQPKISAAMISFPIQLAKKKKSYILKLAPKEYGKLVENEHFFMRMAADCGLDVANTQLVWDKNKEPGLLVERFDRIYDKKTKTIRQLHQEDACQFLNRYPQDKYRLSIREIAKGMQEFCSAPILEISKLIRLKAFSYIIANGDLHAKNISLLQEFQSSRIVLAPAYDLLSTLPYGDNKMALQFEGRIQNLRRKDFLQFASAFGVREQVVEIILNNLCERAKHWLPRLEEIGLGDKKTTYLEKTMETRLKQLC